MFADVSLVSGYSRVVALTEAWPLVARWPDFSHAVFFVLAKQWTRFDVAAVLSSLYPVSYCFARSPHPG